MPEKNLHPGATKLNPHVAFLTAKKDENIDERQRFSLGFIVYGLLGIE